jgi:hypothetical protein
MKVGKKENPSIFLATYWRELMIKLWRLGEKKKIVKTWRIWIIFSMKNQNRIFQVEIRQKFASKRNTAR